MMQVRQTEEFEVWLRELTDRQARAKILVRIDRLAIGNPGDVRSVGGGISEMRITHGPGYRIYFVRRGSVLVILLCGGDKSTQRRISSVRRYWRPGWRAEMATTTKEFDAAAYLETEEDVAAYMTEALGTGDAAMVAHALGVVARARGMSRIARKTGLSRESLYRALSPGGNPELTTVLRIIEAIGLRLTAESADKAA